MQGVERRIIGERAVSVLDTFLTHVHETEFQPDYTEGAELVEGILVRTELLYFCSFKR